MPRHLPAARAFWLVGLLAALLSGAGPSACDGAPRADGDADGDLDGDADADDGGGHDADGEGYDADDEGDAEEDLDGDADADAAQGCLVPAGATPNPFGIGLVGPGDATDWELAADLAGPGGYIKLIFAGITRETSGPEPAWVAAVEGAYARDLVPVIRMAPPWGDRRVRNQSDDAEHLDYGGLAAAFRRVVEGLPRRAGWPLWLEVHNEPNLCYEWVCDAGSVPGDWIGFEQTAAEYAAMLRDVVAAIRSLGDPCLLVANAGLAPGGARRCRCASDEFEAGITSREFLSAMEAAVPGVFDGLDGFASHSYPAEGEGWGFFVPFDRAGPGLRYYETELAVIGRPELPVLLTETGWTTEGGGSREEIAAWTVRAYEEVWLPDEGVLAVMPFMLRDSAWDAFGWTSPDGAPYPVYGAVRSLRCSRIPGRCP